MGKSEIRATMPQGSAPILENRSIQNDYSTLVPLLKPGLNVLDIGCGTGTMTADIAQYVGPDGSVTGIDTSEHLIRRGKHLYGGIPNLSLLSEDLYSFEPKQSFDLIVSARVLQWLNNPQSAIKTMIHWLKSEAILSVLDYDHTGIEFEPQIPDSMKLFYEMFLKWRADAGMNNSIAEDLPAYFQEAGLQRVRSVNADQAYHRGTEGFSFKVGIWSQVASTRGKQLVEDGYIKEKERLTAIDDYNYWVKSKAKTMIMKLSEVRGYKKAV